MSSLPLAELGTLSRFTPDSRFAAEGPAPVADPGDPLADAWQDGYAAGAAEAEAAAKARAEADESARAAIEIALARLDAEQGEVLRQHLLSTVEALCETALAPLALDRDALAARVARAAAMLARADDDRVLRLHPDDLALVGARLPAGLAVEPDPALERGALRMEGANGGVEDGPAHWRRAIAEALGRC